jgi:hypothetical protein
MHDAGGKTCKELNEAYVTRCGASSLAALVSAAEVQLALEPSLPAVAAALLSNFDLRSIPHSASDAGVAYAWLQRHCQDSGEADAFFKKAQSVHKWSSLFLGRDRLPLPADALDNVQALSVSPAKDKVAA